MKLIPHSPAKFLQASLRAQAIERSALDQFKSAFQAFNEQTKHAEKESEEHLKNIVADFLKDAFYKKTNYINTKDRKDLVIHTDKTAQSQVGVILEVKRPGNRAEMISIDKPNAKALHELLLYYLRERQQEENRELKHLVITNIQEWFVFDAADFEKHLYNNSKLLKKYEEWRSGSAGVGNTDWFYKEIATPFFEKELPELVCCRFLLNDYLEPALNTNSDDDVQLVELYKVLSPEHLLKKAFANDSNALNKDFYNELLYLIGLEEQDRKILRCPESSRQDGSLLENTLNILNTDGRWTELPNLGEFGETRDDQMFSIALELCITWLNRILFLKLLEGQLIRWKPVPESCFLHKERIREFDELKELFFEVLAMPLNKRSKSVQEKFGNIPYLNSSLFEQTELEKRVMDISSLKNRLEMPIAKKSAVEDKTGSGRLPTLHYLFAFLDKYDFGSTGPSLIREDQRDLINASVLGLIFEKINGYKEGSFFTPGFVTMYMCQETLRRAVLKKFNELYHWQADSFEILHNLIDYAKTSEYNTLINSVRICDPAVGSGHFLVSALNELIVIKSELGILCDRDGKRLRDIRAEVGNDELLVTDTDTDLPFDYKPGVRNAQRIQEALFHEKQTLIENCLFGVDINPKSVMICRLRLWVELLKNAYFLPGSDALETLPNIDINIKTGNSLVARFPLQGKMKNAKQQAAFKKMTDTYRVDVMAYKHCKTREEKDELRRRLQVYKKEFDKFYDINDPVFKELRKHQDLLLLKTSEIRFDEDRDSWNEQTRLLTQKVDELNRQWDAKNTTLYQGAFEWRFEFPEVLDEDGQFTGFDVVVGNPPYIRQEELGAYKPYFAQTYAETTANTADLYVYFVERGMSVLRPGGQFSYILPNKWMRAGYGEKLRSYVLKQHIQGISDFGDLPVFDEATTYPCILELEKEKPSSVFPASHIRTLEFEESLSAYIRQVSIEVYAPGLQPTGWTLSDRRTQALMDKLRKAGKPLGDYVNNKIFRGVLTGFNKAFVINAETRNRLIAEDPRSDEIIKPFLAGRDLKRYQTPVSDNYLVFTRRGINIDNYPSVKKHLELYKTSLEPKPKGFKGEWPGRKEGSYKWYEIQDAVDYYPEFEKPKICYQEIMTFQSFTYDKEGLFVNNKIFIIPEVGEELLAVVNSKLVWFFLHQTASKLQGGALAMQSPYVLSIPVPKLKPSDKSTLENLARKIYLTKQTYPQTDTSDVEASIDAVVYEMYGLTDEEIDLIENTGQ